MILHCDFEELRALESGARLVLSGARPPQDSTFETAETTEEVEQLLGLLTGSISIRSLAELEAIWGAVSLITETLQQRLEETIVEYHPAYEDAVALYFEHAHALVVQRRLEGMRAEMRALIELMTGQGPTAETASSVTFPD